MEGLGIDYKLLLAQLFNFLVLLFVLKKFLYKPLLKVLDERKKKIDDSLLNAEKIKKELASVEGEKDKILKEAQKKVNEFISEEKKASQKERVKIIEEAKTQANEELRKGAVLAKQELEQAKAQLRNEAVIIAAQMTKKILQDLSEEDKHRILNKLNG